jgi:hypothetical protein
MVTSAFFLGFFTDPDGTFDFWTFLKMSKNDLRKTNLKNYLTFLSLIIYQSKRPSLFSS